jgi:hypothetical protein
VVVTLHHGDHPSQTCTALTLGVETPAIDVRDFGEVNGGVAEIPPGRGSKSGSKPSGLWRPVSEPAGQRVGAEGLEPPTFAL